MRNLSYCNPRTLGALSPGSDFIYQITVSNTSSDVAFGVALAGVLPAEVTFVSVATGQGACTQAGATVNCEFGKIPGGASVLIAIQVTLNDGVSGTITNTATATAINTADASGSADASTTGNGGGCNFSPNTTVPPQILWILGIGLIALTLLRVRRKHSRITRTFI